MAMANQETKAATASAEGMDSAPMIIDLGRKNVKAVQKLRKGKGKLVDEIQGTIAELKSAGTISMTAQPVIVVVREKRQGKEHPVDAEHLREELTMQIARINKSVRKVIQLQKDSNGNQAPVVLYRKTGGNKKMTSNLRPLEKAVRRMMTAESAVLNTYLEKHERSNQKTKDGWLRDMVPNIVEAGEKGRKKLRINRMIMDPQG